MNSLARNALRLSLAGAGAAAVLGAGVVGQASAAELPDLPGVPDTSAQEGADEGGDEQAPGAFGALDVPSTDALPTDALPTDAVTGALPTDALPTDAVTDALPTDALPLDTVTGAVDTVTGALPTDALPLDTVTGAVGTVTGALPTDALPIDAVAAAGELPALDVPGVMYLEAPTVTL